MTKLLMVERAILEVCSKSNKSIFSIANETGMSVSLVSSLCVRLYKKGILYRENNTYSVNKEAEGLALANSPENIKKEVTEITNSIVNNYFDKKKSQTLKLQKVYVNKTEELILNSILDQLNRFVDDLQKNHKKNKSNIVKEQRILMWGHGNYNDLIESSLGLAK